MLHTKRHALRFAGLVTLMSCVWVYPALAQSSSGVSRPGKVDIGPVPPQLISTARFVGPGAVAELVGLEKGHLEIVIENSGVGAALGVLVEVTSDTPAVRPGSSVTVGDLAPGTKRQLTIPLEATLDTETGRATLVVVTREREGNDAPRLNVSVPVRRLERPGLEVVSVQIADKSVGRSRGNGNGVAENGETVELIVTLRNTGVGEAKDVGVRLTSSTSGATILAAEAVLPSLGPSMAGDVRFAVDLPASIQARTLGGKVNASDGRGVGAAERAFSFPITQLAPKLEMALRVMDGQVSGTRGNGNGIAEFGEIVAVELTVSNSGTMAAEGVTASLSTGGYPGLLVQRLDQSLGSVPVGVAAPPIAFLVSVQNSAREGPASLSVEVAQDVFAPAKESVSLNIRDPGPTVVNAAPGRVAPPVDEGPRILIDLPEENQTLPSGESVRLSALVRGLTITRITVLVDGEPVAIKAQLPSGRVELDERMTLRPGSHQILVRAFDVMNRVAEKTLTLTVAAPGNTGDFVKIEDLRLSPAPRDPNAYAVIIGIEQLRDQALPAATYAAADAREVKRFLESVAGLDPRNIKYLANDQATRYDIEFAIEEWLPTMAANPEATVYVYFSGHGAPPDPGAVSKGSPFLVPWDGRPGQARSLYSLANMYTTLGKLGARRVHVWIDACFSGVGERSVMPEGVRPFFLEAGRLEAVAPNTAALLAASGNEFSNSWADAGHGLFTYYLLRGLAGSADHNEDGAITAAELHGYLAGPVGRQSARTGRNQTPVLLPLQGGDPRRTWVVGRSVK